ncbi:unnamed protein product [Cyprideis torosa]|uniref:Uncharacterized protein n=1 Tax=Cyprideis torosa TaxID=163714 RepID=A0A7R8WLG0_9CRUS|nr:unnamed protein product [Cyprideis torosa]CAG0901555.1 unnamed protein product [Cyprideis torosa]
MNRSNSMVTEDESDSETGSIRQDPNGSLLSLTPDRYGFLGGSQYTSETEPSLPVEILRRRERKWIYMFQHWDSFFRSKPEKIRERCLKGIPPSVRGRAWFFLCGARVLRGRNPGLFEHLSRQPCDANIRDEIERDLHRQFPHHEMFADSGGRGTIGMKVLSFESKVTANSVEDILQSKV